LSAGWLIGQERGNVDGRRLAELNDRERTPTCLLAEEPFATGTRIPSPVVWVAYGPVDQCEISDGGVGPFVDDLAFPTINHRPSD
jgi:hypothetical protein